MRNVGSESILTRTSLSLERGSKEGMFWSSKKNNLKSNSGYKLTTCVLLKTTLSRDLQTSQRPKSLLFTNQFNSYSRFPFDYPQTSNFGSWPLLRKVSRHIFLNIVNDFRDLPALVNTDSKPAGWDLALRSGVHHTWGLNSLCPSLTLNQGSTCLCMFLTSWLIRQLCLFF